MNAPVLLAQLAGSSTQTPPSPKNLKLEKPQNGQAVTVHLDGNTKLDFADVASEKLTFVRVGEKLIILFDNQSTVTVDPVFDSMGKPLTDLAFDMGSDRTLTGEQFAQTFPITTDQSVLPAAGGATGPTGGANFGDATVGALGASGARLALLTGEDTGGGFDNLDDGTPNPSPIPGGVTAVTLNEDGFAEGNPGGTGDSGGTATSVTGSLNVDFGTDFVNRSFAFSLNQPTLAGLTSDGQTVQLAFTTVNGQPVLIGYVGGDFTVAANQVFTVSLDASSLQGSYTFTLLRPLDHPIHGTEDTINLSINVIATDGSGDTAPVTISIGINDDTPVIGTPADAALTDPLSGNPATQTGSLGISWGADRYNDHVDGGVSATTGGTGDRSVVFAGAQVTATGDGTTTIGTLTSHGETVHYVLLENGTVLVAYTGDTAPTSLAGLQQSGEGSEGGIASNIVFVATLSDASNSGSYVVTQYRSLDHDNGSTTFQNIDLAFNFTATDSDGDTVNGTLHAVITDTVPVVTAPADDSTLSEGNGQTPPSEGGEEMPSLLVVGGSFTPKDTGAVSLRIDWRSDNQNPTAAGGAHDRSVTFTAAGKTALEALGLTSDGATIIYTISADGTLLTATTAATEGHSARTIFTVQLSDSGNGSYDFTLLDNLDHKGSSGSSQALTFGFIATDSDGDSTAPANFTVHITDDVPTAGGVETRTLSEQTQNGQTNDFVSTSLDNVSLNINWGADDANNNGASIDRKVAFTTAAAPSGLTSNGEAITYVLSENGTLLTASAGDRVVFTVKLSDVDSGTYTFKLLDNLDHVGNNGASIALGFNFTATDADGDPVGSSFTVNITDDVPTTSAIADETLVESTSAASSNAFIAKTLNTISLNVDWNSDDNNQVSGPGATDRSVAFTAATLTSLNGLHLTSNGTALTYSLSDNGQLLTAKAGGTTVFTVQLSDTANGTYTFKLLDNLDHASGNDKNDLALTFGFTATDSDGDTTAPASFTVHVTDDVPVAGVGDTRGVDEDDLLSGTSPNIFDLQVAGRLNIDWNSDDHDGGNVANRSVSFEHTTAADNVAVRDASNNLVNLTSDGATVHYALFGNDLVAYTGNNPFFNRVFVVSLDDDNTGSYTFTLLGHVDHPTADGQNTLTFTFDYTATDSDGDKSSSVFSVTVKDDVPTIGNTESESVREDSLPTTIYDATFPDAPNSTVQLGDLNINWGADNNNSGTTNNRSVVFTTAAGATGLTSDGTAIIYSISADGTVLTAKAGSRTVFTIELSDSGDGSYKFTLFDNIDHAASGPNDDSRTLSFGIKATDSDDDSATANFAVTIVDDSPEAHTGDSRTINENDLSNGTSPNASGLTATGGLNISWGSDDANPTSGGGLGDRAVGFRFSSAGDNVDAENSFGQNLTLRSDGQTVQYAFDGKTLVGYIGANLANGTRIFEVTLSDANDGSYTFKLLGNLDHPAGSGTNIVNLTFNYTATDGDGDTSNSVFTVTIRDDVPEIGAPAASSLTEDTTGAAGSETFVTQTALNKSLNINWGADDNNSGTANRSVAFSSSIDSGDSVHTTGSGSPVLKSNGVTVQFLRISDTEIWGMANDNGGSLTINDRKVFHITLSDTGNGTYTFELLDNLDHVGSGQGSALSLQLGFVATDADGDTDSSSFTVTINDDNGRPSIGTAETVSVDEDGLTGGNTQPAIGDLPGAATSATGSLSISWGADDNNSGSADRSVAFFGISNGQNATSNAGLLTVDGAQVKLWVVGNTVYGYTGSNPANGSTPPSAGSQVFTVSLSDLSAGSYTFNLLKHLDHPAGNNENDIALSFGYRATDADGDVTATSTFTVTVNDDSPVTTGAITAATVLDDDAFAGGNAGGADDVTNATSATGAAGALFSAGADGFKSVTLGSITAFNAIYNDANGVAHQESVTWGSANVSNGVTTWTAIGAVSGTTVATLAIGANGSYTFTTSKPLVHPAAGANEENLSLTFNYTVTDGDNDPATGSLTVNVNDDTPVSQGIVTAATTLDDEAQTVFTPTNAGGASGDVNPDTNTTSGAAGSLFTAGADGFKSVAMTSATFSVVYKDANGFALTETATWGSPVVGANGATTWTATSSHYGSAAVLVIGANGSYTLTVNAPIAHATPGAAEENKALTFNFTVTDGDGDTATGSLTVNVNDDTPVSKGIVTAATTLDDEAQTVFPANAGGVSGDVSPDTKTVSGAAGSLFSAGADGVKSVAMTSSTFGVIYKDANGFAQTETATWGSPVVGANGVTTWTATSAHYTSAAVLVINADGSYSFIVNAPVVHPTNSTTEENKALTFNFTVTDGDGDTATGSLTVNVNDDTVVLGTAVAGFVDEENLAGGNKNDGYPGDLTAAQGDNGTRSTSGSLAIAFGADGKAATVTGGTSTQTFTFSGNSTLTADLIVTQGTVNHPSASGIVFGGLNNPIIINANDSLPFKLDAIDLGLSGAATTPTVILKGYDANNNLVATYTLSVANVASLVSGTPTHFDATGTPFANVLIDRLEIYTGAGFSGYVMADNLVVTQNTASGPIVVDAAVTFSDHSNGLANIVVKDANGNDVTASLTSNGQAVHYAMIDAVTLVGYTGATAPTSLTDPRVVFSAVLSSASANGSYTFTQVANLDHPIAGQEDDLTFTFNFTAKDGDGDKANGHFTVTVDDDAPVATAAVLTGAVYENELSTATGDLSTGTQAGNADNKNGDAGTDDSILVGNLSSLVSMGADSPGTFVVETTNLSASLTSLTSGGVALTYTVVGNTLIAWAGTNQIFTFAVDATTGAYTFTLKGQIDHVANYVIDNASIPVAAIDQPGEIYAVAAINGNPRAFEGRLPDGDVIISVTNSGNTAVNWVLHNTGGGTDYPLSIAANTTIFINIGQISTPPNAHFELTGPGAPNGQTTVNSGHQDIVATGGTDAIALDLSSAVTVRDGDGDTLALHDQLTVTITDDAPVIVSSAVVGTVDETNTPLVQVAYGSLKVSIGADKIGAHLDFGTDSNGQPLHPTGLTSDNVALDYVLRTTQYGEKQLVAFKHGDTADNPVFIVALSSPTNPTYIFTLYQNLDHAANSNTVDLGFTVRVTDGDGDYVDQAIHVNVTDSVPTIPVTTVQRADVQDDALVNGNPEAGDTATASGTLSFNFGADSNGHLSWVSATLPNSGFTSVVNGNVFEIYQLQNSVNVKVFTVTLNPTTGEYQVQQFAAVHHPDGAGELGETFNLTYRVTDGDGDYVDGSLSVVVGDDVPVIIGNATQVNLLSNGDFSGGSAWHDASYGAWATEATGWKISGTVPGQTGVQLERVPSGYFGVVTSNGEPIVDLGASPGNIAISQTLTGLTVGQHYTLSFEIGTYDPSSSGLQVYWNGQLVGTYAPGSTMAIQTLDLIAAGGPNTATFKEVGNASDNTGTYLANVSLVQASSTSLPLFHADIGEDGSSVVSLVSGTNYRFGADGPGSVAFDTVHATISTPTGTLIGVPSMSYDPVTGKVTVNPGWGFNGLSEGEIATLSVPFTVTDSDGDTKTGIYQFTIHGTNDAVRTSEGFPDAGTMTEYAETDPRAGSSTDRVEFDAPPGYGGLNGGGFWIYDDQGDTHTLTVTPQAAGYLGHLTAVVSEETVNDGAGFVNWQYHVTDADLNPLAQGETKVEKFTITVADGHGSTTSREITVTLVGTNDVPVIHVDNGDSDAKFLTENNAGLTASGTLSVTDVDVSDTVTANVLSVSASGSGIENHFTSAQLLSFLSLGASQVKAAGSTTGDIVWTFNSQGEAFDFLPNGWESKISYTIQVSDGHGGMDTHVVEIKIHGTNDAPVIDLSGAATAGNDVAVTAVEQMPQWILNGATLTDVDSTTMHSMKVTLTTQPDGLGVEGLSFNTSAMNALTTAGLTYGYDATTGVLTVTGDASNAVYQTIMRGVVYQYTGDAPSTGDRTVTVVVNDGLDNSITHTATVHVLPMNDAPSLAGPLAATVTEGGIHTLTAAELGYTDPDNTASEVVFHVSNVQHGTITNGGAPATSFTAAELAAGLIKFTHDGSEDSTTTFQVTVEDGNQDGSTPVPGTFTFTVEGVNDAPVITSAPLQTHADIYAAGFLDHAVTATTAADHKFEIDQNIDTQIGALLAATPADMHAVLVGVQAALGHAAGFADAIAAVWDYVDDHYSYYDTAINAAGVRLAIEYAKYVQDGGAPLSGVVVKYEADGPDYGNLPDRAQSMHDNLLGNLDKASIDDKFLPGGAGGSNGPPNGVADVALHDQLIAEIAAAGLSGRPYYAGYEDSFASPSQQWDAAHGLLPGGTHQIISGQLTATDADTNDAGHLTWSLNTTASPYGTMSIDPATGVWSYDLDNGLAATKALHVGEVVTLNFVATVADAHGGSASQTVTITIHGGNDAPVTQNEVYFIDEDQVLTNAHLLANDSDPDGDALTRVGLVTGNPWGPAGSTSVTPAGDLTYTPVANESGYSVLTYQVSDGSRTTPATVTINVRPIADAAVLSASGGNEDNAFAIHIALGDTDGSEKATHIELSGYPSGATFNQGSLQGSVWVIDNPAGIDLAHLTMTPPNNYNGAFNLGVSVMVVDHATLTTGLVTDTATSTGTIAVTVNAVNDLPVLTADDATLTETASADAGLLSKTGNILSNDHDVDGDTLSVKTIRAANGVPTDESPIAIAPGGNVTSHGIYGDLVMHSDGSYTYTANAAFDALADGVQKTDVFKYVAMDGNGGEAAQYLTIHLTGVNDTPVPVNDDQNLTDTAAIDAGTVKTFAGSVLANDHDAENDPLTVITIRPDAQSGPTYLNGATTVAHGVYGDLTINTDGTYTYTPNAAYDALAAGVTATDVFKYGASDGNSAHGGFLMFHITGGNDPAVFTGTDTTSLTESNVAQSTGGTLVVNDVDSADTLVPQANAAGSNNYGVFNVNADGTWTYTMNSAHSEFVAGQTYTDKLTVHSADGTAHDLTVNILGADNNHAPDLVNGTYGGTVTGQVHALPASALVNGSFESGGTGWTVTSQEGGASFSSNFPADGSGNFTANSFGQATGIKTQLTQVVDTLPGLQYTLSFQVLSVSLTPGAHVYVNWNGVQVLAVATAQASGSYHTFTATVTGTGHDTLQFAVDDPNNNPATFDSWRFDAVSLTPAAHYESTSGTIAFTDLDAADTHSVTVSTPVGSNYIGTFVPMVDDVTHQVKWTFYASDTDLQAMTSSTANQTYTIKISDGHGGFDTQDVTVMVAKHVDAAPVITSSAQTGSVTEDASIGVVNLVQNPTFELPDIFNPVLTPWTVSGAGQVHINGSGANGSVDAAYLDQNTTLSQTITTQIGTTYTIDFFLHNYGTPFSVNVNGTPVWTTSNVIQNWTEYSLTFTATSTSTVLSFATTGVNGADIDEVSVQAGTKHIVAGIETNAGTITYTDADLGDTHTVAASGPTFTWSGGSLSQAQIDALTNASSLTLNPTDSTGTGQGSVAWKHSIADSAIQFLNAGQTLTETYTVTIDDGQGGTTSQQVTITINGTNEPVAPTGQTGTLAITEDVTRVLTLSDFGYSDADGDAMASVKISSISITNGKLLYGTSQVTNNQVISAADILAGMLSFAPADDLRSGNSTNGTFAFKVTDSSGMTDATSRTMTLAIGVDQFDAATSSSLGTTVTAAALNSGFGSYNEGGGSGDIFRISTGGATTYTSLNFLRSDNNLEIGWSASGGIGYATLLDQYGAGSKFFETFHFQNGGSYAGYTLAGTSSGGAYTLLSGLTSSSGSNLIIAGTEGNDTISTVNGTGNNLLFGNGGSDTITGGSGNDLIVGGLGNDTLGGRSGNDTYVFGLTDGNDTISEFTGTDRIVIKTGGAAMSGLTAFDDNTGFFTGNLVIQYNGQQITVQNHFFANGFEIEAINFDGGSVYGYALGSTDYAIPTGVTADPFEVNGYRTISIASGNNFISGEIDTANSITGGSGNDIIFGGNQADILTGGNGNNLIVGGKGNDTLGAGTGNDVYAFGMTDGTDTITDTSGTDAIFIATRGAAMSMLTATDNNNGNSHGDLVIQYNGQQVTVVNHFDGGASGANSIESIAFDGGSVYGYDLGTASYAISNLDPNNAGGARTVDLSATSVNNFIAGEDGTSNVITGGSAKDLIFGGSQNDTLSGGAGNDLIQGGAGDDILMGGLGNDVLRGGSGADTFKFGAGHIGAANLDSILDFSNAEGDKIDISGLLDSIAGVQADGSNINSYVHLAQSGNNVVVQVDTTGTGNFSGNTHDVATLVGYGTSNADIVNMVFKNTDHTMTV